MLLVPRAKATGMLRLEHYIVRVDRERHYLRKGGGGGGRGGEGEGGRYCSYYRVVDNNVEIITIIITGPTL